MFPDADATLERAVVSLVVLVWPALGALAVRERWTSAALLVVGITLSAMAAWTPVALTALALGAVAFAVATLSPRRAGRGLRARWRRPSCSWRPASPSSSAPSSTGSAR